MNYQRFKYGQPLFAALYAVLCLTAVSFADDAKSKKSDDRSKQRASCEARGGSWGRPGLFGYEVCNEKTSDAGEVCRDASDCEGDCIAELSEAQKKKVHKGIVIKTNGRCSARKLNFGCLPFVQNGQIGAILCRD